MDLDLGAERGWQRWLSWAKCCRLEPMVKVAGTVEKHLWGIVNAVLLGVDAASGESINSRIKMIKTRARGFRNKNQISIDVEHKLIRNWAVTDAAVHDSNIIEELIGENNSSRSTWANSAYRAAHISVEIPIHSLDLSGGQTDGLEFTCA